MQGDMMISTMRKAESPIQTDTIEGFLFSPEMEKTPNLTVTSGYDCLIRKWVPLCFSILFGKSEGDYENHWRQVFATYEFKSWEDFSDRFPGNKSDMSDALRSSFFKVLHEKSSKDWKREVTDADIIPHYGFCEVHFKRSLSRICRNRGLIKAEEEDSASSNDIWKTQDPNLSGLGPYIQVFFGY